MRANLFRLFSFVLIIGILTGVRSFTSVASLLETTPTATSQALIQTAVHEATASPASVPADAQSPGPKIVTGKVTYTNSFFTDGVAEPEIILEDEGGFVTRDRKFVIPIRSQVIGEITSDFYKSPFSYTLSLPAEPNGTLHDVNHDGKVDKGVMVFAIAYWTNTWGDPYLEKRDQGGGGWSTAYASTRVSDNRDSYLEVFGGKYLVYAPDDKEQFPSGFGPDKKLFTADDPIMNIPAGWSVIDMDKTPFAIDREEKPTIDLIEPPSAALDNFSGLSYTDAFDKMVDKFTKQYAWTEMKKIDWAAKAAQFRPRFEQAQANNDKHAYALALRDFLWSIPDTHVGMDMSLLNNDFQTETAGGLGFAMRDTDDGRIIANFILSGGPADKAGMKWGSEIISLDGKPVNDVVNGTIPWTSPFSNDSIKRLQQLRYALRFKQSKGSVQVTFKNPGGVEQTASLPVVQERTSLAFSSLFSGLSPTALPVEFGVLPSGLGYIKINSFIDNEVLTIQIYERAIRYFKDNHIPGVILDMRTDGGGNGWLADQMAAYFFDKEIVVGNVARYNTQSGQFYMDPGDQSIMIPPAPDLQYSGPVAVLVGPGCASACEFFSYDMTINNRAIVVGQYASEGAGGSVEQFIMPENITVQFTTGRAVDAQGNIHLEGKGVTPTVKVPVTADILKKQADGEDVVLEAAQDALKSMAPKGVGVAPAGKPTIASQSDSAAALKSGMPLLEQKALEQHSAAEFTQPGTVKFTIPLTTQQGLIWAYAWYAKDMATVSQNITHVKLKFILDGEDVTSQMNTSDLAANGQQCRLTYTELTNWPAGEHHLSTTATFDAQISNGTADHPPGDYILDYTVDVSQ